MPDTASETSVSQESAREQTCRPKKPQRPETKMRADDRAIAVERCPFADRNFA